MLRRCDQLVFVESIKTWGADFFFQIPKMQHVYIVHLQENKKTDKVLKKGPLLVLDTWTTFWHVLC